jgi:hypothetical protein
LPKGKRQKVVKEAWDKEVVGHKDALSMAQSIRCPEA